MKPASLTSSNDVIRFRIKLAAVVLLFPLAGYLVYRLYTVQITMHDEYLGKARARYTTTKVTTAKRGEIFDHEGHLLVSNIPAAVVTADPGNLTGEAQRKKLAYLLSANLDRNYRDCYERLSPTRVKRDKEGKPVTGTDGKPVLVPSRYAVIARDVPLATAEKLKEIARINRINGVLFFNEDAYMRTYPKGTLLSNVLGYTNLVDDSFVPQIGLEKQLNQEITGNSGLESYERTRDGLPLSYGMHESVASRDGKNIYLTIREPIQAILEEELDAAFEKWKPKTLYAAIVDPKTGDILAIAQRPTFNPNIRSTFTPEAARTRIVEDGLEPGSIAKPFSVGKALDWRVVTPEDKFDCEKGRWMYLGKPLTDSHAYEMLSVSEIIQKSSNIGTAKIGLQLGPKRVYDTLKLFGLGDKTGLPFPLETSGYVPPLKRWDGLSITRFPIGYGIRVSPVQMLRAYCALANNGLLPQLRLIDRIEDPETHEITKQPILPPKQLFDRPEAHRQLVEMMIRVTEEGGTARKAAIPGYEVAGKTGTSRKFIPGRGYAPGKYFSSFIGFVPARDPALVMLVTMDEPTGSYYAGTVSAPTFSATALRVLRHLNIPPDPARLPAPAANGRTRP